MSNQGWRRLGKSRKAPHGRAYVYVQPRHSRPQRMVCFPENSASEGHEHAYFMHNEETEEIAIVFTNVEDDRTYKVGRYTPGHVRISCGVASRDTWIGELDGGRHDVDVVIKDLGHGDSMVLSPAK